jgi:hypothetical protein
MNLKFSPYIICLILFFQTSPASGQSFSGIVVDKETSVPLPYASLGVKGKNIGGIADRTGHFYINVSQANKDDSIIVSNIGYESIVFLVKDLITEKTNEIRLTPKAKVLQEVIVVSKRNLLVMGNQKYGSEFTGWGDFVSSRGRCRGLKIEPKEFPVKITAFDVRLKYNDFDSVKLRLHIYNHNPNTDVVHELLRENVFFTAVKDQHWVEVDLEEYNILMTEPLWVTIEWVDTWTSPKSEKGSYLLTFSMGGPEGYSCSRETPEEPYTINLYKSSPTMYLKGYRVNKN